MKKKINNFRGELILGTMNKKYTFFPVLPCLLMNTHKQLLVTGVYNRIQKAIS